MKIDLKSLLEPVRRDEDLLIRNARPEAFRFSDVTGFHIYCELRPTAKLEIAESDAKALKYLQIIEEYVNHGVRAAVPFGVVLLELQGNVLHFFKPGESVDQAVEAIQFAYLFTSTLYDELKPELGDEWDGFASCIDHGRSIIVRHGNDAKASTVSLSPAANRPAKQLLYGKTPSGCLDMPAEWAKFLPLPWTFGQWATINLRDRERMPLFNSIESPQRRQELLALIREYRANTQRRAIQRVSLLENRQLFDSDGFTLATPHRVQAFCLRPDLDGFSAVVKSAFETKDERVVEGVARGFAEILEFGDYMENSTQGSIRLPWAGDCATLLVPPTPDFSPINLPRWVEIAMKWQSFAAGTQEAKTRGWGSIFQNVKWAVGACHGAAGMNVVAPIQAQGRSFLVGAGWPIAMSLEAQNLGKGGDIVTHHIDYGKSDGATRKQFEKVKDTEFWKTSNLTSDKLRKAAVTVGGPVIPAGEDYLAKYHSIQVPSPRPHFR